jgi:hypothetical protein
MANIYRRSPEGWIEPCSANWESVFLNQFGATLIADRGAIALHKKITIEGQDSDL